MSTSLNKVYLLGNAGQDGELKMTKGGVALGTVSIATNRSVREAGGWVQVADWHRIKAFGELGKRLAAVRKGESVFVEAELQYSRWTNKEGVLCYGTDLVARVVVVPGHAASALTLPDYEPRAEEPPIPEEP